jgi:recombination protein RecT
MNELQPARKLNQVEVFIGEVLSPDREQDVLRALPAGVDPIRFKHSLSVAVMQNPNLMKVHPGLLFREVSKAASLGLSMDPQLGEAYLVISRNSKANRDEPQLRIGYKGLIRLARNSGEISLIYAHAVHQRDIEEKRFSVKLGDNLQIHHEPDVFSDRGPVCGYYAILKYRDGETDFEPMSVAEIHKIRDRTDAYRAFKAGRIKSTPWADWESEMARKTVIRRLLKRSPMSAEMQAAVKMIDEEEEGVIAADATPPSPRQTRAETLRAIARPGLSVDSQSGEAEAPKRGPGRPRKEVSATGGAFADIVDEPEPATADHEVGNESETQGEQDEPESADVVQEPIDEPAFDRKSPDYKRGADDFAAGLKRCLNAEIRADVQRFENWKAGWLEAKEEAEEADGREDT